MGSVPLLERSVILAIRATSFRHTHAPIQTRLFSTALRRQAYYRGPTGQTITFGEETDKLISSHTSKKSDGSVEIEGEKVKQGKVKNVRHAAPMQRFDTDTDKDKDITIDHDAFGSMHRASKQDGVHVLAMEDLPITRAREPKAEVTDKQEIRRENQQKAQYEDEFGDGQISRTGKSAESPPRPKKPQKKHDRILLSKSQNLATSSRGSELPPVPVVPLVSKLTPEQKARRRETARLIKAGWIKTNLTEPRSEKEEIEFQLRKTKALTMKKKKKELKAKRKIEEEEKEMKRIQEKRKQRALQSLEAEGNAKETDKGREKVKAEADQSEKKTEIKEKKVKEPWQIQKEALKRKFGTRTVPPQTTTATLNFPRPAKKPTAGSDSLSDIIQQAITSSPFYVPPSGKDLLSTPPTTSEDPVPFQDTITTTAAPPTTGPVAGGGWSPRKKLSPDTLLSIRSLHVSNPTTYTTPFLAEQFKVSPEAMRRILKSKWTPRTAEERRDRRERWARRYDRIWDNQAAMGLRPQRRKDRQAEGDEDVDERFEDEVTGKRLLGEWKD